MAENRTKADERWVSRGLVNMLIREMKDYKAAAEVVSGSPGFAGALPVGVLHHVWQGHRASIAGDLD